MGMSAPTPTADPPLRLVGQARWLTLAKGCGALNAGLLLAVYQHALPWQGCAVLALGVSGLLALCLCAPTPLTQRTVRWGLALVLLAVGASVGGWRLTQLPHAPQGQTQQATLVGEVYPFHKGWILQSEQGLRVLVRSSPTSRLPTPQAGDTVALTALVELPPDQPPYPAAFHQRTYLLGYGLHATAYQPTALKPLTSWQVHPHPLRRQLWRLHHALEAWRLHWLAVVQAQLGQVGGALLASLVIGERAAQVPANVADTFKQTGLVHYLAASGMNVGVVGGAVWWLLGLLPLPWRLRLLGVMVMVWVYASLTGWPPSIQRAATVMELGLALKLGYRQLPPVAALLVAVSVLTLWQPWVWLGLGFQLSVVTALGILATLPHLQQAYATWVGSRGQTVMLAFAVPTVAQVWATPLLLFHFNQWAWHSVVLNALVAPLVGGLTLVGFVSALATVLGLGTLGGWLLWPLKPVVWLFASVAQWGSQQGWAMHTVASPPAMTVVLWLLVLLAMVGWVWPYRWSRLRRGVAVGALLLVAQLPWLLQQASSWRAVQRQPWQVWDTPVPAWLFYPQAHGRVGRVPALVLLPASISGWEAHQVAQRWRKTYGAERATWVTVGNRPWRPEKQADFAQSLGLREANALTLAHWPLALPNLAEGAPVLPVWQAWQSGRAGESPVLWAVHNGQGMLVVLGQQAGYWGPDWGDDALEVPLARRVLWATTTKGLAGSKPLGIE